MSEPNNIDGMNALQRALKRVGDVVGAMILLVLFFPFCLILFIIYKLTGCGDVLYRQERIGLHGRPFQIYKFRTMITNAESDGVPMLEQQDDARLLKYGKFMRSHHIDEIPQLLNVLIGDMALIGPRPDSAFYLEHYTPEERVILRVRPGITGWNQAVNRNSVGTKEKLKADIYYVEHLSFGFDLKVIWLTIKTVLSHKDVYRV